MMWYTSIRVPDCLLIYRRDNLQRTRDGGEMVRMMGEALDEFCSGLIFCIG